MLYCFYNYIQKKLYLYLKKYSFSENSCNKLRQYERTKEETIVVGLELPNQEGKLIRFIPRNITIITKQ